MYDALNSIDPHYKTYLAIPTAPVGASIKAAISQAAHDVLISLYPSQQETFSTKLTEDLLHVPEGQEKEDGILVGKTAAALIIADRAGDGSEWSAPDAEIRYKTGMYPGQWRRDPLHPSQQPLTPEWGKVRPFLMTHGAEFRVPAPPTLNSPEYAAAFAEVKRLGGDGVSTPTERTDEQTFIGVFWGYDGTPSLCAPVKMYNHIAVQIGFEQGLDISEMTHLLALANLTLADAGIASWESKYYWNYWRPVTGIREAEVGTGPGGKGDGNSTTIGDSGFVPYGAPATNRSGINFTPPFPAYPSGHATFGGALFEVLRRYVGTDDYTFTFVSDEFNGETVGQDGNVRPLLPRTYTSFSQAAEENGLSRVYLGIHWSFDAVEGILQGEQIAPLAFERLGQR